MHKNTYGFTIVELLIVIVVIAILAAITLVSYNGIQERATLSAVKSDLRNIGQQAMLTRVNETAFDGNSWFGILQASGVAGEDISSQQKAFAICWNADNDFAIVTFQPVVHYDTISHGDTLPYYSSRDGGLTQLTWDSSVGGSSILARTCNQTTPGNLGLTRGWSWQFPNIS